MSGVLRDPELHALPGLIGCPTGPLVISPEVPDGGFRLRLSLVIPTYNERQNIGELIKQLTILLDPVLGDGYEMVLVDDDSQDRTWELAAEIATTTPKLRVIRRQGEKGLSTAVIRGWQAARGEILAVIDADLQHALARVVTLRARDMVAPMAADVAIASGSGMGPLVTIVVPTYKEAESLPHLLERIAKLRDQQGLDIEVLIIDDDSRDGSAEAVAARGDPSVQLIVRTSDRGLSPAVLDGMRRARGEFLVCMDADLSHPPEAVPDMLAKLREGADFVVGSRYAAGGTTSDDWGVLRWLNSRVATLLARPLTSIKDPMAGFFALRRSTFEAGRNFNPIGYKIGLELLVKCQCERAVEIPIHFEDRRFGESKLTLKQQILYVQHLRRLYIFKYGAWTQLLQFLVVGGLGTIVNLAALTAVMRLGLTERPAVASAIFVAMCFNFVLNRRFSFSAARRGSWVRQFVGFVAASSIGAALNYATTVILLSRVPEMRPQLAALVGIAAGTALNFVASRYLVFRAAHVRVGGPPT